jgi:phosphoribosylglycinamide formyltransferase-1
MTLLKLGVLVSGSGTNLQAIIDSIENEKLPATVEAVISSRADAYAITRAKNHGIPAYCVLKKEYPNPKTYEAEMLRILESHGVELVVLAGFLTVLSSHFINKYRNRIINIHPALLPSFCGKGFYGIKVHEAVIDSGVRVSGATVHFVDEGTDTGPIILQEVVPVLQHDTSQTLADRVLQVEHQLLPEAIRLFADGRLLINGGKVIIKEEG